MQSVKVFLGVDYIRRFQSVIITVGHNTNDAITVLTFFFTVACRRVGEVGVICIIASFHVVDGCFGLLAKHDVMVMFHFPFPLPEAPPTEENRRSLLLAVSWYISHNKALAAMEFHDMAFSLSFT